jgi:hypothetical protein
MSIYDADISKDENLKKEVQKVLEIIGVSLDYFILDIKKF